MQSKQSGLSSSFASEHVNATGALFTFVVFVAAWAFCLAVEAAPGSAQVHVKALLLTQEKDGWRASSPDGEIGKYYPLKPNDLLVRIDGRDAKHLGPLAVLNAFNLAFNRRVPVDVLRDGHEVTTFVWRGSGSPPAAEATSRSNRMVTTSDVAPAFELPTLDGAMVRSEELKGRWTLLSFWATWCAPCVEEAPFLSRLAGKYRGRLNVVAVALGDELPKVKAFAAKQKPLYMVAFGGSLSDHVAGSYGFGGVPDNVLIRPDGSVAYAQSGYDDPAQVGRMVSKFLDQTR